MGEARVAVVRRERVEGRAEGWAAAAQAGGMVGAAAEPMAAVEVVRWVAQMVAAVAAARVAPMAVAVKAVAVEA
jgi:hypothetical protein